MSCENVTVCMIEKAEAKEFAYFAGLTEGAKRERKRILRLISDYWCGEPNCKKHGTDWEDFIKAIEENK